MSRGSGSPGLSRVEFTPARAARAPIDVLAKLNLEPAAVLAGQVLELIAEGEPDRCLPVSGRFGTAAVWGFTLAIVAVLFRFVAEAKVNRIRALSLG